jgi:phosphatidylethanolamine-binding protein (PEBP) family uncharacterized protein
MMCHFHYSCVVVFVGAVVIIPDIYTHGPDWHWLAYNLMEMTKVIDEEELENRVGH